MSENSKLPTVPPNQGFFRADPLPMMSNLHVGAMATWNAATNAVTLDWPAIEQAAERQAVWDNGMMRGFARMLLVAREAGRNDLRELVRHDMAHPSSDEGRTERAVAPNGFE